MHRQQLASEVNTNISDEKQVNVTLLGDSTIDNRVWVDGFIKSALSTRLGIKRAKAAVRVQKSHRFFCKPELSVVENVMDLLPGCAIHDYTNDGFTTYDVLHGAFRDKVFGRGTFSLFPHEYFQPLVEGEESIKKSQHIIVSVGGNDFREFLQRAMFCETAEDRKLYIQENIGQMFKTLEKKYLAIVQRIRELNSRARIILMTQYYPSASQNNYKLYPFMQEIGEARNLGGGHHDPMTVAHEIMKETYRNVLKSIPQDNIVVADLTSSLNLYDNNNYVSQIEPSGIGGKKIAEMLKYLMTSDKVVAGQAYRFFPQFFATADQFKHVHVEARSLNEWVPAHPYDLKEGYTQEEEIIFRKYDADQLNCNALLQRLGEVMQEYSRRSPMHEAALAIKEEGENLLRDMPVSEVKKWKMSVVLTLNVLDTFRQNKPECPEAIRLLNANAEHRALGKGDSGKRFKGALAMLVGAALMVVCFASIPFSFGMSAGLAVGLVAGSGLTGALLFSGGVVSFLNNTQGSLAKETSTLATVASRQFALR